MEATTHIDSNEYIIKIAPLIKEEMNKKREKYLHETSLLEDNSDDTIEKLKNAFKIRQDKMKEGNIAQIMIGNIPGWEDLGRGHSSGLDCKKDDNSMIMEIKNKYNTCNSGSEKAIKDKLATYKKNHPKTRCIWGIINPKKNNKNLSTKIIHNGVEIEKIQGIDILKLVFNTNDEEVIDKIINDIKKIMYN